MAPPEWHIKFALEMLKLAEKALAAGSHASVASAVLRAFEEIIDAYAAKQGFHFHDEYPNEAAEKRIGWIEKNNQEIFEKWKMLILEYCDVGLGEDGSRANKMVNLLRDSLQKMQSNKEMQVFFHTLD